MYINQGLQISPKLVKSTYFLMIYEKYSIIQSKLFFFHKTKNITNQSQFHKDESPEHTYEKSNIHHEGASILSNWLYQK